LRATTIHRKDDLSEMPDTTSYHDTTAAEFDLPLLLVTILGLLETTAEAIEFVLIAALSDDGPQQPQEARR
jgi:hypothetical protein